MFEFLHSFSPTAELINLGPVTIYWYGLFIVTGVLMAITITVKLAVKYDISKDDVVDLAFWTILGGIIGARFYHVLLELPYYLSRPGNILQVWKGGIAIHGGLFVGLLVTLWFVRKKKIRFVRMASIIAPGLILAQAIGRWGNYFNQELFGLPTDAPWGIPVKLLNRPDEFISDKFFHPTFLYESLGSLLIFVILISIHVVMVKKKKDFHAMVAMLYLVLYSLLRFFLEFIRIDPTPIIMGWRLPQIVSILIIIVTVLFYSVFVVRKAGALEKK